MREAAHVASHDGQSPGLRLDLFQAGVLPLICPIYLGCSVLTVVPRALASNEQVGAPGVALWHLPHDVVRERDLPLQDLLLEDAEDGVNGDVWVEHLGLAAEAGLVNALEVGQVAEVVVDELVLVENGLQDVEGLLVSVPKAQLVGQLEHLVADALQRGEKFVAERVLDRVLPDLGGTLALGLGQAAHQVLHAAQVEHHGVLSLVGHGGAPDLENGAVALVVHLVEHDAIRLRVPAARELVVQGEAHLAARLLEGPLGMAVEVDGEDRVFHRHWPLQGPVILRHKRLR